jgi:hypothetical protein
MYFIPQTIQLFFGGLNINNKLCSTFTFYVPWLWPKTTKVLVKLPWVLKLILLALFTKHLWGLNLILYLWSSNILLYLNFPFSLFFFLQVKQMFFYRKLVKQLAILCYNWSLFIIFEDTLLEFHWCCIIISVNQKLANILN